MNNENQIPGDRIALFGIFFLFFLQLLSDFIEGIYVFGLLGTSIPTEIVSVVFLLAAVVLVVFRKRLPKGVFLAAGFLVLIARVVETMLDTRGGMLVSGVGVAAFLVFFPALFTLLDNDRKHKAVEMGVGLLTATAIMVCLKTVNSSVDVSITAKLQVIWWFLAIAALYFLWEFLKGQQAKTQTNEKTAQRASIWRVTVLSVGITSAFLLLYFAFASPTVMARWSSANYISILCVEAVAMVLAAWLLTSPRRFKTLTKPGMLLVWNSLLVLALVLTILPHQVAFPASSEGYPLPAPEAAWYTLLPLYILLLCLPVVLVDFVLLTGALLQARPTPRRLGGAFTITGLYLLVMILAHVFTTVYDYIPVVGPFFRDKFWLVYLVAGLGLALPVLLVEEITINITVFGDAKPRRVFTTMITVAMAVVILSGDITAPNPKGAFPSGDTLSVLTYNIQQGYSEDGRWNFDGQLDLIREVDPDILGLQECDTARISGGNKDVVRYFADHLDMYSFYGPSTVTGTFGIALLSKYPIENARTFFMYSEGEQVAAIEAQISVGSQVFNIYVTHLGNDGPFIQQEQFLEVLAGKENVIAMGDFNFRPGSEQYALTTTFLEDAYLVAPVQMDTAGFDPQDRIDHVFTTLGTQVEEAQYIFSPASDHPALVVVITLRYK